MKKYILIIAVIFVLLISSFVFLPYIFKDRILKVVKKEASENLTAQLDFSDDIGINLFKSFPDLELTLRDFSITHTDSIFLNDTLFAAKTVGLSFDLLQFYQNQEYIFKSITVKSPLLNLETNENDLSNWDIFTSSDTSNQELSFKLELDKISLINGKFSYVDGKSAIQITGINHNSTGFYENSILEIEAETHADKVTVAYDDITYLPDWEINQKGLITADLENYSYAITKNDLRINGLPTAFDGSIKLKEDDIFFDLTAEASSPDLNNLLTLIPAIYLSDYSEIETRGSGSFTATFKGIYNDNQFPSYGLKTTIIDGWFKYPDVSNPVEDINLSLQVFSSDGSLENTIVEVNNASFKIAEDNFDGNLLVEDILDNPKIDAKVRGKINLDNLSQNIPLKTTELKGNLKTDLAIKGRIKDIQNSAVDQFFAKGGISSDRFFYKSSGMNSPLDVKEAKVKINNQTIRIDKLVGQLGTNDFDFKGQFSNFFSYLLQDETLKGSAVFLSKSFNLNDFYTENIDDEEQQLTIIEIPGNLDLNLTTAIENLKYDDLSFKDFSGDFLIENTSFFINGMASELLGGRLSLTGKYDYKPAEPAVSFNFQYSAIHLADLFQRFKVVSAFAPIADKLNAVTSANLSFSSPLDIHMSPLLQKINLNGAMSLIDVDLNQLEVLKKIDQRFNESYLSSGQLKNLLVKFNIENGELLVEPFDFYINKARLNLDGKSKLDGSISYQGNLKVPSIYLKNETAIINDILKNSSLDKLEIKPNEYVDLGVAISGSFREPSVSLNLESVKKQISNSIEEKIEEELADKKEELEDKAQKEIDEVKRQAEEKARETKKKLEEELNKKKQDAEDRLKKEADEQKKKIEEEARKKLKDIFKR